MGACDRAAPPAVLREFVLHCPNLCILNGVLSVDGLVLEALSRASPPLRALEVAVWGVRSLEAVRGCAEVLARLQRFCVRASDGRCSGALAVAVRSMPGLRALKLNAVNVVTDHGLHLHTSTQLRELCLGNDIRASVLTWALIKTNPLLESLTCPRLR